MKKLDRIKCKGTVVSEGPKKGEEVVGHYSRNHDGSIHFITELEYHLVPHDPEHHPQPRKGTISHHVDVGTVRQWTGKVDKFGEEIYEGDLIGFIRNDVRFEGRVKWNTNTASFQIVVEMGHETLTFPL